MIGSPADIGYFVETARALNMSRAAERLGISQPSLSVAMRRLENAVGTALFTRSKRGVALTPAGKRLLTHSHALVASWARAKTSALASMNEATGDFTIGCHVSVALYALPGFLPGLMSDCPGIGIGLRHGLSRQIVEDVISSRIDIGIAVNPVRHPDLVIHRLCQDVFTLWSAADFPSKKNVLFCDPDLAQTQILLKRLEKSGTRFDRIVASDNLEVIAGLTSAGGGFGLLPGRVAARCGNKLKPVKNAPSIHDDHCLLFRVENKGVRAIQVIRDAIRKSMGE